MITVRGVARIDLGGKRLFLKGQFKLYRASSKYYNRAPKEIWANLFVGEFQTL